MTSGMLARRVIVASRCVSRESKLGRVGGDDVLHNQTIGECNGTRSPLSINPNGQAGATADQPVPWHAHNFVLARPDGHRGSRASRTLGGHDTASTMGPPQGNRLPFTSIRTSYLLGHVRDEQRTHKGRCSGFMIQGESATLLSVLIV